MFVKERKSFFSTEKLFFSSSSRQRKIEKAKMEKYVCTQNQKAPVSPYLRF
jgi:hypothetical protein